MLTILQGDALEQLQLLPAESVHCCVTSPPYWGLRDYGTAAWEGGNEACEHRQESGGTRNKGRDRAASNGTFHDSPRIEPDLSIPFRDECGKCGARRIDSQLGLERTPEEYVAKMVEIFREVRRVLRRDGTLWLNLGDSYSSGGRDSYDKSLISRTSGVQNNSAGIGRSTPTWAKPKDLLGIPWRVAFALQADGWWLRSDIIWAKPNPMPESVTDRPTKSHEYIFLLTKSASYYYDGEAIKEKTLWADDRCADQGHIDCNGKRNGADGQGQRAFCSIDSAGRNKRSVWTIATQPYLEAHFATFPQEVPKLCIMAGTSAKGCCASCGEPWERIVETESSPHDYISPVREMKKEINKMRNSGRDEGFRSDHKSMSQTTGWEPSCKCQKLTTWNFVPCTVLDPFAGSGTTGAVALELGRKAVLIELNPHYVALIEQRCNVTLGLALA